MPEDLLRNSACLYWCKLYGDKIKQIYKSTLTLLRNSDLSLNKSICPLIYQQLLNPSTQTKNKIFSNPLQPPTQTDGDLDIVKLGFEFQDIFDLWLKTIYFKGFLNPHLENQIFLKRAWYYRGTLELLGLDRKLSWQHIQSICLSGEETCVRIKSLARWKEACQSLECEQKRA